MRVSATIVAFLGTALWICSCEKVEEELRPPLTMVTDYDGNTYYTAKIGDQWWMTSNLKTTHYADGSEIPWVESTSDWEGMDSESPAYCYYDNNPHEAAFTYGALYTWAAAMNGASSSNAYPSDVQGVCPDGWHVPSDNEWKALEMHLGMHIAEADTTGPRGPYIGSQLAISSDLWSDGLLKDNASFGTSDFFALPGGGRRYNGTFGHLGDNANFWTATERDSAKAWGRHLYNLYTTVHRYGNVKSDGFSVRCVKDD